MVRRAAALKINHKEVIMNWPKGRYNGMKIDGFMVSFKIHVLWWNWKPIINIKYGQPYFIWLCFSLRGELSYKI
jgi:hypothetical protein